MKKNIIVLVICISIILVLSGLLLKSYSETGRYYENSLAFNLRVYPGDYLLATIEDNDYSTEQLEKLLSIHDYMRKQLRIYCNHDKSIVKYYNKVSELYDATQELYDISVNSGLDSEKAIKIREKVKALAQEQIDIYNNLNDNIDSDLEWYFRIKFDK